MNEQMNNKRKLMVTFCSLLMAFAVLGTASFAWFTLSTNPEISGIQFSIGGDTLIQISDDGEEFDFSVDISNNFGDYKTLRPVSTIDGLNWFVADYDEKSGNIKESTFYKKNWCVSPDHGKDETTHSHCDNDGFYAYTDIWLKCLGSEEIGVRLATPADPNAKQTEDASGCYVLSYVMENDKVKILNRGPETCARIGMLVFDPPQEGESVVRVKENEEATEADKGKFFIYEPNANRRSEINKSDLDNYKTDVYISGFLAKDYEYDKKDGKYISTYPISADDATEGVEDKNGKLMTATPHLFDKNKLVVQTSSKWLDAAKNTTFTSAADLMTNEYVEFGTFAGASNFYSNLGDYTAKDMGTLGPTSQELFTIPAGEIRQVRLFFWIEGQDVDCWNDVAGMNFLARLEFSATIKSITKETMEDG